MPLYPLKFRPLLKERIWGGRMLESLYRKQLPPGRSIGESWEISDRPGDISVVDNGPLTGTDLHSLVHSRHEELAGRCRFRFARFPLLVKILDAREKLSLQVHPPANKASSLGGEPKSEMWYIAHAEPGAELYVGLRRGVTRSDFEAQLRAGTVEQCFHRLQVRAGDTMFLPSGRVHAIGAGLVIFEIQQNSDTTYRVFDWNRLDRDGKPRPLHITESLASIDFEDYEPPLTVPHSPLSAPGCRRLVTDPVFVVDLLDMNNGTVVELENDCMHILGVVSGNVLLKSEEPVSLFAGEFCLVPAGLSPVTIQTAGTARVLRAQPGDT